MRQLDSLYRAATELTFFGEQSTLRCVVIQHDGFVNSTSESDKSSGGVSALFLANVSGSTDHESSSSDVHNPYTEKTCRPQQLRTSSSSAAQNGELVDFSAVDAVMTRWLNWAAALATEAIQRPPYPTYNNPYFSSDAGDGPMISIIQNARKRN